MGEGPLVGVAPNGLSGNIPARKGQGAYRRCGQGWPAVWITIPLAHFSGKSKLSAVFLKEFSEKAECSHHRPAPN